MILRRDQTLDAGVVKMLEPGSLRVTVTDVAGKGLDGVELAVVESAGAIDHPWGAGKTSAGSRRIDGLGSYRLRTSRGDLPSVYVPFTIVSGEVTKAALEVPAGVQCRIELSATTEPVPIELRFRWYRDGEPFECYDNLWEARGIRHWSLRLLSGRYEVKVASETGREVTTRFVLSAKEPVLREIRIVLP